MGGNWLWWNNCTNKYTQWRPPADCFDVDKPGKVDEEDDPDFIDPVTGLPPFVDPNPNARSPFIPLIPPRRRKKKKKSWKKKFKEGIGSGGRYAEDNYGWNRPPDSDDPLPFPEGPPMDESYEEPDPVPDPDDEVPEGYIDDPEDFIDGQRIRPPKRIDDKDVNSINDEMHGLANDNYLDEQAVNQLSAWYGLAFVSTTAAALGYIMWTSSGYTGAGGAPTDLTNTYT